MNGWPKKRDSDIAPYYTRPDELSTEQGCILWGLCVVIPPALQQQMIHELHHEHVRTSSKNESYCSRLFLVPGN